MTVGELRELLLDMDQTAEIKFIDKDIDAEDRVIEIGDVGWAELLNSYVLWSL